MDLQLPLGKSSFDYPDDSRARIAIDQAFGDDSARWRFRRLQPEADYLPAVCAERLDAHVPALIVRRTVPLRGDACPRVPADFRIEGRSDARSSQMRG